jgi:hypothetical protein
MEKYLMRMSLRLGFLTALILCNSAALAQTEFSATISEIPKSLQQQMIGHSWNPGCPVPLNELAYLKLSYWGYDKKSHTGFLVVHKSLATEVVNIFKELYVHRFPINEMKPYETYPQGEYAKHNDTVGVYCCPAQDNPKEWSSHAYGIAVDINPLVNPYYDFMVKQAWPIEGKAYLNRNQQVTGMLQPGDAAFNAFTAYGWIWGGFWKKGTDNMHFRKEMTNHYVVQRLDYRPSNTNPTLPDMEL